MKVLQFVHFTSTLSQKLIIPSLQGVFLVFNYVGKLLDQELRSLRVRPYLGTKL